MALTKLQSFNIDPTANFTFANLTSGNANLGNAVTANYFIGNLHGTANIATIANSVDGPNVSGQVGNSLVASTVYTNAQPNITSVGTLSNLTSNGTVNFTNASNVALGAVGNVKITGGVSGQFLQTDGTGTLSWSTVTGGGDGGGGSAVGSTQEFSASTGQTSFNITGGYQVGSIFVFINDVQQASNSFTATNGNVIVLSQPSTSGDVIKVAYSMPALNVNIFDYHAMIMGIVLGT